MNAVDELIRLYAKQLKIPSFAEYQEVLRQADPSAGFSDLLLELMKAETASRQENQNRRRLKAAGFPYLKTMEEFDCSQLNDAVSPLFLQELASCQFIQNRQNVIMAQAPCHAAPVQIEDTVVVQTVDLHAYDAFLCGKAGAAV